VSPKKRHEPGMSAVTPSRNPIPKIVAEVKDNSGNHGHGGLVTLPVPYPNCLTSPLATGSVTDHGNRRGSGRWHRPIVSLPAQCVCQGVPDTLLPFTGLCRKGNEIGVIYLQRFPNHPSLNEDLVF